MTSKVVKKTWLVSLILLLIPLGCFLGINELRKGHTFYLLKVDKNLSLEFVYDYFWEVNSSVFVVIHKRGYSPITSASVDGFTPGYPAPTYDFVKSKQGIIGVFRKDDLDRIVFLLDPETMVHVPFMSNVNKPPHFAESDHMHIKQEWEKVREIIHKFQSEYPNLDLPEH